MTPWYAQMGLYSLIFHIMESQIRANQNVDWTKMPNPFGPEFQFAMFIGLFVHVFLWPIVWIVRVGSVLLG